nr:unnamed protein product [Digitaria exilis]
MVGDGGPEELRLRIEHQHGEGRASVAGHGNDGQDLGAAIDIVRFLKLDTPPTVAIRWDTTEAVLERIWDLHDLLGDGTVGGHKMGDATPQLAAGARSAFLISPSDAALSSLILPLHLPSPPGACPIGDSTRGCGSES